MKKFSLFLALAVTTATVFAVFIMTAPEASASTWNLKAPYDFALQGASGAAINGKIYIVCGVDNSGCHNELREYDPVTNTYMPKAPFPGTVRQGGICFALNGYLYYGGGEGASFAQGPYTDMWKYDPMTNQWAQGASLPAAFAYAASVVADGKGYVLGGLNSVTNVINDSIRIYDPSQDTWTSVAMPAPMVATYGPAAFAINDLIYYGTGFGQTGATVDFWRFDPASGTASAIAPFPGLPRSGAATFPLGELGFVIGGTTGCVWYADVFAYDVANELWIPMDSIPTGARTCAVGASVAGNGYVIAGAQNIGVFTQETYEYGSLTTHVTDIAHMISVKAYPNPAVGSMMLELPSDDTYHVTICDVAGRVVLDTLDSGLMTLVFPRGVYMCSVEPGAGAPIAKLEMIMLVFQ